LKRRKGINAETVETIRLTNAAVNWTPSAAFGRNPTLSAASQGAGLCGMMPPPAEWDMPSGFERAHHQDLIGSLTTVDRLIIRGHLSQLWYPNHMAYLLDRLGVQIARDFGQFVKQASSKVVAHAKALAKKAGRPFILDAHPVVAELEKAVNDASERDR
jgi:hypothetical protein